MKRLVIPIIAFVVWLLLGSAELAQARWCNRTYQVYHSYIGWNQGCSTTGCHASSGTNNSNTTANNTYSHTYSNTWREELARMATEAARYKGNAEAKAQENAAFTDALKSLNISIGPLGGSYSGGSQYGNLDPNGQMSQLLLQYARPGLSLWGSTTSNYQQGYGVAPNWAAPQLDAAVGAHLFDRSLQQIGGLMGQVMDDASKYSAQDNAQSHANKMELARMMVLLEGLKAVRAAPSSQTVTNSWQTTTTPDGGVQVAPLPQQPPMPQPPPQPSQPVGAAGGNQYGNSVALGPPPDVVQQKCNECHNAQKKVLIGPGLSPDQRVDAMRRMMLAPDDPDFMPKKPSAELGPDVGNTIMGYIAGRK